MKRKVDNEGNVNPPKISKRSDDEFITMEFPLCVETILKPHQRAGIQFLWNHLSAETQSTQGCILADYMGLGKTLQVLCTLDRLFRKWSTFPRVLILAPTSVVNNWKLEIEKWFSEREWSCSKFVHVFSHSQGKQRYFATYVQYCW